MVTYMNEQKIQTLDDVKVFLAGTLEVEFSIQDKDERYRWIEQTLRRFNYRTLGRADRGVVRVKRVLDALGVDTSGVVELEAHELVGRQVEALFQTEEREDPLSGRRLLRLRVPYAGYAAVGGNGEPVF